MNIFGSFSVQAATISRAIFGKSPSCAHQARKVRKSISRQAPVSMTMVRGHPAEFTSLVNAAEHAIGRTGRHERREERRGPHRAA